MPFYRSFQVSEPKKVTASQKTNTVQREPSLPVQNIIPEKTETPSETQPPVENISPEPRPQTPVPTPPQTTPVPVPTPSSRFPADLSTASFGGLRVSVGNIANNFPIDNATVQISETVGNTTTLIDEIHTTAAGETNVIELPAPPREYSEEAGSPRPYAEYNLTIRAEGFEPVQIIGTEVLPDVVALQRVQMLPLTPTVKGCVVG